MKLVLIGLWLSSCSIHLMKLRIILPPIGMLLATLGFRMLRKSHPSFARAWQFHLLRSVFLTLALLINFSLYRSFFYSNIGWICFSVYRFLSWIVLHEMTKGLKFALKECDYNAPEKIDIYIIKYTVYLCLSLLFMFSPLPDRIELLSLKPMYAPSPVLIFDYIFFFTIAYITYRLFDLLMPVVKDDFVLPPIKEKIPDKAIIAAFALGFALSVFFSVHFLQRYPMKWRETNYKNGEIRKISAELLIKGFPYPVIKDLSEEDLLIAQGSSNIRVYTMEDEKNSKKIRFTVVFFQPLASDQLRIIRHFQWLNEPEFLNMEAIRIYCNYYKLEDFNDIPSSPQEAFQIFTEHIRPSPFFFDGRLSGRVLCRQVEKNLSSPYSYLGLNSPKDNRKEPTEGHGIYATFSFPKNAKEARGYIAYDLAGILPKDEELLELLKYLHHEKKVEPIVNPIDLLGSYYSYDETELTGFCLYQEKNPVRLDVEK